MNRFFPAVPTFDRLFCRPSFGWLLLLLAVVASPLAAEPQQQEFDIPADFLQEAENIPDFWLSEPEAIRRFLAERVERGSVEVIGHTAGGREIPAVLYGQPREGKGTTTFSGSLGFRDVRAYFGPDHEKRVLMIMGGVHGGEFEGIVSVVNLIAVLETGRDLRGKEWPGIVAARDQVDRLIILPVVNVDGRARIPLRMEPFAGTDNRFHQFYNTGYLKNGTPIGWPMVKEFIPLDFSTMQFPGGYPNDAGVNIQHDDFFGDRQPETDALFALAARERPDVTLNMHTGAPPNNYFMRAHKPLMEPVLHPAYDKLYRHMHTALTEAGLQGSRDPEREANPAGKRSGVFNLDAALNFHTGALPVLIESPSHSFAGLSREGDPVPHSADMLVDAHLIAYRSVMEFLIENGGRSSWVD